MSVYQKILVFKRKYFELSVWILALVLLAFGPTHHEHYSLCLFKGAGFESCPGCGLGHSITFLFQGKFSESLNSHPLGIPAVIILVLRIISILKNNRKYKSV